MPTRLAFKSKVRFGVTPRFEIFYALRALGANAEAARAWAQKTWSELRADFEQEMSGVAPHPIIWALLADSIRDVKTDPRTFSQLIDHIQSLRHRDFQTAILGGVFRRTETVSALLAGEKSLAEAVSGEREASGALLRVIGLDPFDIESVVAATFNRLISDPASYRTDLTHALDVFWRSSFSVTWDALERRMEKGVEELQSSWSSSKLSSFGRQYGLPVAFDDRKAVVTSLRGTTLFPYSVVQAIHVIPSAFNDAGLWAAYKDAADSVRLYFPVFDSGLLAPAVERVDPATGFRALGDTTRYAIAGVLARHPQTSVDLAKTFGVSKPTISHHVRLLRAAGLLSERTTDNGIVLTLNRGALEQISIAAADEMFGEGEAPIIRRSRREGRARAQSSQK